MTMSIRLCVGIVNTTHRDTAAPGRTFQGSLALLTRIYAVYIMYSYVWENNMPTQRAALLLKFKDDTLATVSRESVKSMAKKLGFNETQVAHYALARLREELLAKSSRPIVARDRKHGSNDDDDYAPLTAEQLAVIRKHAPKRRGKPLTSESLF